MAGTRHFSILIPVYNTQDEVSASLASVTAQTLPEFECICVDDGSRDNSGLLLDDIAREDARFRIVHQLNRGVGQARNRALSRALGDWIVFLDSDDILHPRLIEWGQDAIRAYPEVDFWYYDFRVGEKIDFGDIGNAPAVYIHPAVSTVPSVSVARTLMKRERMEGVAFRSLSMGEDIFFAQQVLARSRCVGHLLAPLYGYVMRGTSITHNPSARRLNDELVFATELIRFYQTEGRALSKVEQRRAWTRILLAVPHQICIGHTGEAFSRFVWQWWRAIKALPLEGSVWWQRAFARVIKVGGRVRIFRSALCRVGGGLLGVMIKRHNH